MTRLAPLLHPFVLALVLLAACAETDAPEGAAEHGADAPTIGPIDRELGDLTRALTPLPPTATNGERHAWFARRKETLERLRQGGPALGRAALAAYLEGERPAMVRAGFLDVAAHAAPEDARAVLVELVTEYGADLGLRKEACRFLGETSPATAIEVLEPIVSTSQRSRTYPPDDQMIEAWLTATKLVGADPGPVLATIVTDSRQSQEARHKAAEALGEAPSAIGRAALEQVLVESGGNNYLRRKAAQSLRATLPAAELCAKLEEVLANEADQNFALFLDDMQRKSCP